MCTAPASPSVVAMTTVSVVEPGLAGTRPPGAAAEITGIASGLRVSRTFSTRNVTSGSHHGVSMRTSRLDPPVVRLLRAELLDDRLHRAPKEKTQNTLIRSATSAQAMTPDELASLPQMPTSTPNAA